MRFYAHKSFGRLVLSCGLCMQMSACAFMQKTVQPGETDGQWRRHLQQVSAVRAWDVSGRLAIKGLSKGVSGGFRWTQASANYEVQLRGPFGRILAVATVDEQGATFTRAGQAPVYAPDADRLFARYTDYAVPVAALHYWLRGLPAPDEEYRHELDDAGRLIGLRQLGWTLTYTRYQNVDGMDLPAKFTALNQGLTLRFVLSDWHLAPP